jgi:hypothetical protein
MVEERWHFDEEPPEPLIPELRPRAAVREQPPTLSSTPVSSGKQTLDDSDDAEIEADVGATDTAQATVSLGLSEVTRQWEMIKKACKTKSPKLAALLNNASPVAVLAADLPQIVIQVEFEFHYKQLLEPGSREIVSWALGEILEMPCKTNFLQKHEPIPASSIYIAPSASAPAPSRQRPASASLSLLEDAQPLRPSTPNEPDQPPNDEEITSVQASANGSDHQATNGHVQAPAPAFSARSAQLPSSRNGATPRRQEPPPVDLLKETVLRDPVVEEVIRTYDASLVEWKRLEE